MEKLLQTLYEELKKMNPEDRVQIMTSIFNVIKEMMTIEKNEHQVQVDIREKCLQSMNAR